MIHYELIIPSASRPHLLDEVLRTLFIHLDQLPARVILHDDARFPGKQAEVADILRERVPKRIPTIFLADDPPISHGPAVQRMLGLVSTEYVLYSQDDHNVVRDLSVGPALRLLDRHRLNQIRFNKRDTMDKKGREGAEFFKVEKLFNGAFDHFDGRRVPIEPETIIALSNDGQPAKRVRTPSVDLCDLETTLCVADHWYFQTGVWRVAAIKPVLDWWVSRPDIGAFSEHMEVKVNQTFNGEWAKHHGALGPEVPILKPEDGAWNDPEVRARVHKTFIWGRIGEPKFVEHSGVDPKDWALIRGNRDQPGPAA